jgi:hypothetical protein
MTAEKLLKFCKYYWYTGILKGIMIAKCRPSDYSEIAKDVQEKGKMLEEEFSKEGNNIQALEVPGDTEDTKE